MLLPLRIPPKCSHLAGRAGRFEPGTSNDEAATLTALVVSTSHSLEFGPALQEWGNGCKSSTWENPSIGSKPVFAPPPTLERTAQLMLASEAFTRDKGLTQLRLISVATLSPRIPASNAPSLEFEMTPSIPTYCVAWKELASGILFAPSYKSPPSIRSVDRPPLLLGEGSAHDLRAT